MVRIRFCAAVVACLVLAAIAPAAPAKTVFHPRIGGALGLMPPVGKNGRIGSDDVASGALIPVMYHGGNVMTGGVTIHTIFWAPSGFAFQGQPAGAPHNYEGMIEQFLTDATADDGHVGATASNVFSVLPQFAEGQTAASVKPGQYELHYSQANSKDLILDTDAYPSKSVQCASPQNTAVCITDGQLQAEVSKVIDKVGGSRGFNDIWYVFTPPGVDECILPGECESNAYGGYHSVSDLGKGPTIYAYTGDPIVEARNVNEPGNDPEGYPDAEIVIDIVAHETVEAMTDPEGVGYMDPNGFEVGDKCEFGPQYGPSLGFAPNGSPYNQVIGGHEYMLQEMWANIDDNGNPDCVQHAKALTNPALPLPQVYMRQYDPYVSGNTERTGAFGVTVLLKRAAPDGSTVVVAKGSTTSNATTGQWTVSLFPHAVGDDRDEIDVHYSGAGHPTNEVILTGNGGNPFLEAGWTGWFDLDNGSAVTNSPALGGPSLSVAPCFQTGVLRSTRNGVEMQGPNHELLTDFCNTQTDVATLKTSHISRGDVLSVFSLDNRAFSPTDGPTPNANGALISLQVPVGEPDAVSQFVSPLPFFNPTGYPSCTGDLEARTVTCTGLVPGDGYRVTDGSRNRFASADSTGTISVSLPISRGDRVTLSNGLRTLTTLHVAQLRVDVTGAQTVLSGGRCQAGQYYGPPLTSPPLSSLAGEPTAVAGGSALTGEICPLSGSASGLPSSGISQTDELSGDQTQTEVPDVENTSPLDGEVVYGAFTALADSGLPGPNNTTIPTDSTTKIALAISKASGGAPVFRASNVDTPSGVRVSGLKAGSYRATWTLHDANGDTRTVITRFVEQSGSGGGKAAAAKPSKVSCTLQKNSKVKCTITYAKRSTSGTAQVKISRGGTVGALGHGSINHGVATVTMTERKTITGKWTITVVTSQSGKEPSTFQTTKRF